jgi:hypothetical protein
VPAGALAVVPHATVVEAALAALAARRVEHTTPATIAVRDARFRLIKHRTYSERIRSS